MNVYLFLVLFVVTTTTAMAIPIHEGEMDQPLNVIDPALISMGCLNESLIPPLDHSIVTSGYLDPAQIPDLQPFVVEQLRKAGIEVDDTMSMHELICNNQEWARSFYGPHFVPCDEHQ